MTFAMAALPCSYASARERARVIITHGFGTVRARLGAMGECVIFRRSDLGVSTGQTWGLLYRFLTPIRIQFSLIVRRRAANETDLNSRTIHVGFRARGMHLACSTDEFDRLCPCCRRQRDRTVNVRS